VVVLFEVAMLPTANALNVVATYNAPHALFFAGYICAQADHTVVDVLYLKNT
jgi:hypothetical protein